MRRAVRLARAYDWLTNRSQNPYLPYANFNAAIESPMSFSKTSLGWLIPPGLEDDAEKFATQTLVSLTRIRTLQNLIVAAHNPGESQTYALPPTWREALADKGIPINQASSRLAWLKLQFSALRGAFSARRKLLGHAGTGWMPPELPFSVLIGTPYQVAKFGAQPEGFSFFDWLSRDPDIVSPDDLMLVVAANGADSEPRDGRLRIVDHPFPRLSSSEISAFRRESASLLLKACFLVIAGNWWSAFLVQGALETAYFNRVTRPANRYVFTNAVGMYLRPLWTYEAERRGSPCSLIYYSAHIKPISGNFPNAHVPGIQLQYWGKYLVFNELQKQWLENITPHAPLIRVAGPIDYADDPSVEIELPPRSILALDVPVRQLLWWPANGFIDHFSTGEFSEAFFSGLAEVADQLGAVVIWKGKRQGSGPPALAYKRAHKAAADKAPFVSLESSLSPRRLAHYADACIAAPFTSAALLFRAGGGAAAYFDPLAKLPKNAPQTDGLPLLQNRRQLVEWLEPILDAKSPIDARKIRSATV